MNTTHTPTHTRPYTRTHTHLSTERIAVRGTSRREINECGRYMEISSGG